jgi:hypothetical protein
VPHTAWMKFGRKPAEPHPSTQNPYLGLRAQFLTLGQEQVDAPLRGVALELGMAGAVATIVCVADGTTSMYTSTGGGYIGMGKDEQVRQANAVFRAAVAAHLDALATVDDVPLPPQGEVNVVAVTADGLRLLSCLEREAQDPGSPAHLLYVAGQDVVTRMRLVAEAQQR